MSRPSARRIAAAIASSARFLAAVSARATSRAAARAASPTPRMYAATSARPGTLRFVMRVHSNVRCSRRELDNPVPIRTQLGASATRRSLEARKATLMPALAARQRPAAVATRDARSRLARMIVRLLDHWAAVHRRAGGAARAVGGQPVHALPLPGGRAAGRQPRPHRPRGPPPRHPQVAAHPLSARSRSRVSLDGHAQRAIRCASRRRRGHARLRRACSPCGAISTSSAGGSSP